MLIRFAKENDLQSIVYIYNQAIDSKTATADSEKITIDDRKDWFAEHHPNQYPIYVVETDNKIVGWGSLSPYRKGRKRLRTTAEITYYIDYNYQQLGYAKQLIDFMIKDCKRLKIDHLLALLLGINTSSENILKQFGFSKWGILRNIVDLEGVACDHLIYGINLSEKI